MIAAAVSGTPRGDGIYFLPAATTIPEMSEITGREAEGVPDRLLASSSFDGSAVAVAAKGDGLEVGDMPAAVRLALGLPIDLNHSSQEELLLVPGIGESVARAIVQLREQKGRFHALEELKAIPGIKGGKLRSLEKYLAVASVP
jgi:competence protein ComEA